MKQIIPKLRILFYSLHSAFRVWKKAVWQKDLDQQYCCDGRECGCQGATIREIYL